MRLPPPHGRLVDRSQAIRFSFEGREYSGFAGDTIASALAANGVHLLSRSFKYHRPRGPLTMAGQDGNTLVQLPGAPNVLADRRAIEPGLEAFGQNYAGSLERDRGQWIERLGRFLPVGFYYKAFYKPRGAWDRWEKLIRRKAGLGKVDLKAPRGYYDKQYLFADVAVGGGGTAGMHAALAAADAGAEVLLIDENPALGGALLYTGAADAAAELAARVADEPKIAVLIDAVCTGWFADHWLAIQRGNRLFKARAKAVVIATGSIEQPMIFRNNDLPGVMLGSAAQRLIHLYGVRPGRRAVVATANGDGYGVALDLAAAGVEIAAVVDLRPEPLGDERVERARERGLRLLAGHTPWEALAERTRNHIAGARIAPVLGNGQAGEPTETIACDLLCMSVGYAPAAQLLCHAGTTLGYDDARAMFTFGELRPGLFAAGSVANSFARDAVAADGRLAGRRAADHAGFRRGEEPPAPRNKGADGINHPYPYFAHPKGRDFVDFDEDLQMQDILDAIAEGYDHVELLKRYSTVGMGPSQGRLSSLATVRLAARATGRPPGDIGTTTARPPYLAEAIGVLAGRGFEPERLSPMHHRHLEAGAQMMPAGTWWRPAYYGPVDKRDAAIHDEVLAIRHRVGLIDVSTLGGIEVRGPDAAEFLDRIYTFTYKQQAVGRSRYVLMCDQAGAIVDDGVACRFGERHFYVTATTGGADAAYRQMLWWNAQWRLDVDIANVTAAYCGINIAGPESRNVLSRLAGDLDLSPQAFPYLAVREGTVAGIPCRLLRVGFVGELGYELHAPAGQGEALWDALLEAGRDAGIRPVGIEAQRVLRLEKGHIIVGQDTDGLTHPYEAQMAWAVTRKKPFFVGGRAIEIQMKRPLARKLIGFVLTDPDAPPPEECHLTVRGTDIVGRVTSAARSPTLGKVIGLAYVAPDQAEPGSRFHIKATAGRLLEAEVVPLPFYDPDSERQAL